MNIFNNEHINLGIESRLCVDETVKKANLGKGIYTSKLAIVINTNL